MGKKPPSTSGSTGPKRRTGKGFDSDKFFLERDVPKVAVPIHSKDPFIREDPRETLERVQRKELGHKDPPLEKTIRIPIESRAFRQEVKKKLKVRRGDRLTFFYYYGGPRGPIDGKVRMEKKLFFYARITNKDSKQIAQDFLILDKGIIARLREAANLK